MDNVEGYTMKRNRLGKACHQLAAWSRRCQQERCCNTPESPKQLSNSCCGGSLRICGVNGDRRTCARMASLGFLPGREVELVCKAGTDQCVVKINGSTISLDADTAAAILVAPA